MTPTLFLLFALLLSHAPQGDVVPAPAVQISAPKTEVAFQPFQAELLHQAFDVVAKMPTVPHAKNRARAEEAVFVTCMQLEQLELAAEFAQRIDNWRQASAFADLALVFAERNQCDQARKYLEKARKGSSVEAEEEMSWRRDRVLAKVALAEEALAKAEAPAAGTVLAGTHQPAGKSSEAPNPEEVRAHLQTLPEIAKVGDLESLQAAMQGAVGLYGRCIDQPLLRQDVYQAIQGSWRLLPGLMRVRLAFDLVEVDLAHQDLTQAKSKLDDTTAVMEGMVWEVRHRVPALAELAKLRLRAGQPELAREQVVGAQELYTSSRATLIDIYRTEALVPVAEAWMVLVDREAAEGVYQLALQEALVNPNSKPRAEDLSVILCSMAKAGFQPSQAWSERCDAAVKALSDPW